MTISAKIIQPYAAYLNSTSVHKNEPIQNTVENTFKENRKAIEDAAPGNYTITISLPEVKIIPIINDRMSFYLNLCE